MWSKIIDMRLLMGSILALTFLCLLFANKERYLPENCKQNPQQDSMLLRAYSEGYTQGIGIGIHYYHDTTGMRAQVWNDLKEFRNGGR